MQALYALCAILTTVATILKQIMEIVQEYRWVVIGAVTLGYFALMQVYFDGNGPVYDVVTLLKNDVSQVGSDPKGFVSGFTSTNRTPVQNLVYWGNPYHYALMASSQLGNFVSHICADAVYVSWLKYLNTIFPICITILIMLGVIMALGSYLLAVWQILYMVLLLKTIYITILGVLNTLKLVTA